MKPDASFGVLTGNNIDFTELTAVVRLEDLIAMFFEIITGQFFTEFAGILPSHMF